MGGSGVELGGVVAREHERCVDGVEQVVGHAEEVLPVAPSESSGADERCEGMRISTSLEAMRVGG